MPYICWITSCFWPAIIHSLLFLACTQAVRLYYVLQGCRFSCCSPKRWLNQLWRYYRLLQLSASSWDLLALRHRIAGRIRWLGSFSCPQVGCFVKQQLLYFVSPPKGTAFGHFLTELPTYLPTYLGLYAYMLLFLRNCLRAARNSIALVVWACPLPSPLTFQDCLFQ